MNERILFISGSIGLGHAKRDLEIARELHRLRPDVDIVWLADEPARSVIKEAGENIAPESVQVSFGTRRIEEAARDFRTNMTMIGVDMMRDADANAEVCRAVVKRVGADLVIGDETYDLLEAIQKRRDLLNNVRLVFISDFLGFEEMTENPVERNYVNYANSVWYRSLIDPDIVARSLFVGVPGDIPDKSWGPLMPTFRDLGSRMDFLGYILSFEPAELADRDRVRAALGYGPGPLIICTVGGTSVGRPLLDLCARAFPIVKSSFPQAKMVLACGPRIDPREIEVVDGVEVRGYVPDLYKHLAACDVAITTASGTTSLELLALKRPFIYFPLEQHFEQNVHVSGSNLRRGADLKMVFSQTSPEALAGRVIKQIGREVDYPSLPLDGARKAAEIVNEVLGTSRGR